MVEVGPTQGLTWLYVNKPNNLSSPDMHGHNGVTHARVMEDGTMHCEYFNCARDRQTYGTIVLARKN